MFYLLSFFYGAAIGSFVNVIVTRLGVAPIVKARSKCLSCGETIKWKDLIPVFSYTVLKGKCRDCKSKFGVENLLIEVVFGGIFLCVYNFILSGQTNLISSFVWLVYYTLFFVTLGVVTLYDLKHKVIPINFFYGFMVLSLFILLSRFIDEKSSLVLLAPLVVSLPFFSLWVISKGKWLGFGDVLMYMAVGAFFGVSQGLAVFFLSIWLGAIVGLLFRLFERKKYHLKSSIPFVPFIAVAIVIVLFTDIDIFGIFSAFR